MSTGAELRRSRPGALAGLPKRARIRKRVEYQLVQSRGLRLKLRHFVFLLFAREWGPNARLGITASRKVGGAVVRNRAKRLVREAFRASVDLFPQDIDLVVIVLKFPSEHRLSDVLQEWQAAAQTLVERIDRARRVRDLRE